jgi:hypothetical protein
MGRETHHVAVFSQLWPLSNGGDLFPLAPCRRPSPAMVGRFVVGDFRAKTFTGEQNRKARHGGRAFLLRGGIDSGSM